MKNIYILIILTVLMNSSCRENKKVWNGDPVGNYPAISDLLADYFDPFVKDALRFRYVKFENESRDTAIIDKKDMPIKKIRKIFEGTNIKKDEFDKKYKIDFVSGEQMEAFTMLYKALPRDLYVRSISILANRSDREMRSLYIETDDPGFVSSKKERILLIPGDMIQIQTSSTGLFTSEKKIIETYILID